MFVGVGVGVGWGAGERKGLLTTACHECPTAQQTAYLKLLDFGVNTLDSLAIEEISHELFMIATQLL